MKSIYLVDYWVPFPSSEYGGIISIIAENDQECFNLLSAFPEFDNNYSDRIMPNIVKAPKFSLVDGEESKIVDIFIT